MSLLELVCAIFVITGGVFAVFQSYFIAMDKMRDVNEYHIATRALVNELETLRAAPFDTLVPGVNQPFRSDTPALSRLVQAEGRVSIRDHAQNMAGLKEVVVHLRWRGEHGRRIEKKLTTLIAEKN